MSATAKFTDKQLLDLYSLFLSGPEIARELKVNPSTVYERGKKLGLTWGRHKSVGPHKLHLICRIRRKKLALKIHRYIEEKGIVTITDLYKFASDRTIQKTLREHTDMFFRIKIEWSSAGHSSRGSRFIKSEFLTSGNVYIASRRDRQSIVRFLMKIFKKNRQYHQYDVKTISSWLKSKFNLSRAERVAIITSLGYRYKKLEHIKINGYLNNKPRSGT